MDWNTIITDIFQVVIIPLLGIAVGYFVKWVNAKTAALTNETNNELVQKYLEILNQVVCDAVVAVNQTYVDSLKEQGAFDLEAQKEAFNKAYNYVICTLTEEGTQILSEFLGDLGEYITVQIEAEVKREKQLTA